MRDTTPVALAVIKPQGTDPPSVVNLAEKFQRIQHEYDGICGDKLEQAIQSKLLVQRKAFIHHLESMFSEINDISNRKIRETNAKFGLTLPLEESKKISASDVAEHDRRFITITADSSSLTRPTKIPDDTVKIAQLLEDKRSLQNEIGVSKQTVIKLEAEKKQDKTTIARCQFLHHEVRQENTTLKKELKKLEEKIQHYEVVANSCSRIHHGSFHAARCFRDDDGFHDIEGRPPADRNVIDARNNACHKGDIMTDYALFKIDPGRAGWNIGGERYVDFTNSYRVTPHEWAEIVSLATKAGPDRVILEVLNSHATMYRCHFNTKYTHSPENDESFNVLFSKFFDKYKGLWASTNLFPSTKRYENLVTFVKQAGNDRRAMREIVGETVAREKAKCFSRARLVTQ